MRLNVKISVFKTAGGKKWPVLFAEYILLPLQVTFISNSKKKTKKNKLENLSLDYMFPETQFMSKWLSFAPTLCLNTHPVFRVYPVLTQ